MFIQLLGGNFLTAQNEVNVIQWGFCLLKKMSTGMLMMVLNF